MRTRTELVTHPDGSTTIQAAEPPPVQSNPRWDDDSIQFPRLLCEIMATQQIDYRSLCEAMDLDESDIEELFDRAVVAWEMAKERSTR